MIKIHCYDIEQSSQIDANLIYFFIFLNVADCPNFSTSNFSFYDAEYMSMRFYCNKM